MQTTKGVQDSQTFTERVTIYNDFSIHVATINGSGSQTSNMALTRALFRMGVTVSGKNLFPSNIQGLPTWFTLRVCEKGYVARRENIEILITMNQATVDTDIAEVASGGVCFYADHLVLPEMREDLIYYPMPVKELVRQVEVAKELRDYIANMVYVGIVAQLMEIDLNELRGALDTHFQGKSKPVDLNMRVITTAAEWAENNITKIDPYHVRRLPQNEEKILIDGNLASALGAIYGGLTFAAWYPITPASSLADGLTSFLPRLRRDEQTGKRTYTVIQAEDEISAIGMAIGAGWAGARSMTSTSGPGISLMAEFAGYAFFAEIPVVIWNVQRMGPSTGLPTRTSQGDVLFTRFLGHGDTEQILLLPGSVSECFEFGWRAFDLAEKFQTPIFVLSDLDLGMNLWVSDPFDYPEEAMDRGKVLTEEDLEQVDEFARYRDVDGDGIPYRTLPGTDHPQAAYFTRGTGHTDRAVYSENPDDWVQNFERLKRKHKNTREQLPLPVIQSDRTSEVGLIGFGSTDPAIIEAVDRLATEGLDLNYMRIRALPVSKMVEEFIQAHERVYVIEMNSNGQMHKILQLEVPEQASKLHSLTHNNGLPITARWISEMILESEGGKGGS